jgi:FAD/FMN-containing dehydrogenase
MNETPVAGLIKPAGIGDLSHTLRQAAAGNSTVSVSGGRHAMGGQQFGRDMIAIDCRGMNRILELDVEQGIVEVEAGITWPQLVRALNQSPTGGNGGAFGWTITQKQTGADELTLGGALAANVHGRGLSRPPIVSDVESFRLMRADGEIVDCSRTENTDLFSLAIGGYGLFGVVCSLKLRLIPRRKLRRVVEVIGADELGTMFDRRIREGFNYGDFQFSIDHEADDFLQRGVFSCYRPVADDTPMPAGGPKLSGEDWKRLIYLAHVDKKQAFDLYTGHYARTNGQVYWSDEHQFTVYQYGYHRDIDARLSPGGCGGEMITEIYVPREELAGFLAAAADGLRRLGGNVIYGTVRLIERERETFLGWARQNWACVIFNLCVRHEPSAIEKAKASFLALIDLALERGGSFYLTYHRWARRDQLEAAYPQFHDFLRQKRRHDPEERFQSDWYRHYRAIYGEAGSD